MGTPNVKPEQLTRIETRLIQPPEPGAIGQFATWSASTLLRSEAGKAAGYWEKPFLGSPRVSGSAYVIGTYTYFVLGCVLAGASAEPLTSYGRPQLLSNAQSLAAYYLEFPPVKQLLDSHFEGVDKHAGETLSSELRDLVGSARDLFATSGIGRPEENLLSIVWNIVRQGRPFSIDQAIESFASTFLYGASMMETEVERLWGIQVQATVIPLMDGPLAQARLDTVSEIAAMVATRQSV